MFFLPVFIFICSCQSRIQATLYPIQDNVPILTSNNIPLTFTDGGPAFLLASNNMIRFNYRTIRVTTQALLRNDMIPIGWSKYSCNISKYGLCQTPLGVLFPIQTPLFGPDITGHHLRCKDSSSKALVNYSVYDISACDVIQNELEVVYVPGYAYIKHTTLVWWKYWIMVLASILVVRAVSLNIISKLQHTKDAYQYTTILVISLVWILIITEGDSVYITENDLFFFWMNIIYIMGYLAFHAYHSWYKLFVNPKYVEPRVFNLAAALLQAVLMRLYGSTETPYTMVIVGVICTRIWEKESQQRVMHIITGMIDTLYMSLLLYMGYTYDIALLFPVVLFARILSKQMSKI